MKPRRHAHWISILALVVTCTAVTAVDDSPPRNEDVALRYIRQVLDGRNLTILEEIFQPDVVMHRPERTISGIPEARVFFESAPRRFAEMHTEIHDVISSGDRVVIRLSHRAIGAGTFRSRIGSFDIEGKTANWDAIAIFRIKDGKIAEEWVNRDELGILLSVGAIQKKQ